MAKDRRKRNKAPGFIYFISIAMIVAPVVNTLFNSLLLNVPIKGVIEGYDLYARMLLGSSVLIGIGLLTVSRWGFSLFFTFCLAVLSYNTILLFTEASYYNVTILIASAVFLGLAWYLVQKDIRYPFLSKEARGFRRHRREQVKVNVIVDGQKLETIDLSTAGMKVIWPGCPRSPGDEVEVNMLMHTNPVSIKAGVVRQDGDEVSLAYRFERR